MAVKLRVCGIGWPGDRPGFAAVLELSGQSIYLKKEIEAPVLADLISACTKEYQTPPRTIAGFIGRPIPAVMSFIAEHNQNQMNPFFNFGSAPMTAKTGDIYYHWNLIQSYLLADKKRLWFIPPEEGPCMLRAYVTNMPKSGVQKFTDLEYPAVAALGYGLAYLDEERRGFSDEELVGTHEDRNPVTGY